MTLSASAPQSSLFARAEDEAEDEGVVEEEGEEGDAGAGGDEEADEDGAGEPKKNVSPDADTTILFTRPPTGAVGALGASSSVELPAGQIVEFLVGFSNKGGSGGDFVIETLDASFRYPMDFSYHIQNFSAIAYQKTVRPGQEATVAYSFIPADAFAGRPIGLTVNLAYRDTEGNFYFDPVFNETVQIVEFDEGFDTEVFFMYVMMAMVAILGIFLVYSYAAGGRLNSKSCDRLRRHQALPLSRQVQREEDQLRSQEGRGDRHRQRRRGLRVDPSLRHAHPRQRQDQPQAEEGQVARGRRIRHRVSTSCCSCSPRGITTTTSSNAVAAPLTKMPPMSRRPISSPLHRRSKHFSSSSVSAVSADFPFYSSSSAVCSSVAVLPV